MGLAQTLARTTAPTHMLIDSPACRANGRIRRYSSWENATTIFVRVSEAANVVPCAGQERQPTLSAGLGVFGPHPRRENLIILAAVSPAYR